MSSNKQTFIDVIQHFKNSYDVKPSGTNNIKLGTRTFTPKQFHTKFKAEKDEIADACGGLAFYKIIDELKSEKSWSNERCVEYMSDQVFGKLKKDANSESKKLVVNSAGDLADHEYKFLMHVPILDTRTDQRIVFDTATNKLDPEVSYKSWLEWAKTRPIESKKLLLESITPAKIDFNPYEERDSYYKDIGRQKNILHINSHVMPEWRKGNLQPSKTPPKMFLDLVHHLFPKAECRDYVYQWMKYALTDRNECYLVLHGIKGLGKTTFAYVCRELVGGRNYATIDDSFWETNFSGELKNKRLVYIDECAVTSRNISKVRAMTNRYINIEEKGLNAITLENHCSYIWASNPDKKHTAIDYEARRYSVPELCDTPIKEKGGLGQDWLDEFHAMLNSEEDCLKFFKQLGYWVLNYEGEVKHSCKHPYKTSNFNTLLDDSLSEWKKDIIDIIKSRSNDVYDLHADNIRRALNGTGRGKLKAFLDSHRDKDGKRYGRVLQRSDNGGVEQYIEVTPDYFPDDIKEMEEPKTDYMTEDF